ncbi:trichome birefringence-like protein [Actinidia rufa]|uniref:Trichome birefringence-like protein n=1 Tax=Actinidia rufa TaxID=165716 RepID=A0A7J0DZ17_9ERIC|nr:trichome birefringence-like protein [Actinidia rufa]
MDTNSTINRTWKLCAFTSFIGCLILTLSLNHHHNSVRFLAFRTLSITITSSADTKNKSLEPSLFIEKEKPANRIASNCNIFDGKWIYKPVENPLYDEFQCPFLSDQVSCQRNGRPDFGYESWSWEANDCQIPRNQWESLACLLYSVVPASRAHVDVQSGVYKVFRAKDYNCSVEFYWSPFLIQLDTNQANGTRVLRLDKIVASAQHWRGADVMVFNTGHTGGWDLFQYRGKLTREMDIGSAFEIAMKTWAQWIDRNIDSAKTTVFFRSISPEHKGKHWCYNVTQPIMDESYRRSIPMVVIEKVEKTIGGMRTPVRYLNITNLSEYRRDAHPMVYAMTREKVRIEKQRKGPESLADCSHWCLPGLPDTWNRLLYTLLFFNTSPDSYSSSHEVV